MNIVSALAQLDELNDDHWTADGAPVVQAVGAFLGRSVSRQEITAAAPHFSRKNTELPATTEEIKVDPAPTPEEAFSAEVERESVPMPTTLTHEMLAKLSVDEMSGMIQTGEREMAELSRELTALNEEMNRIRMNVKIVKNAIAARRPEETNQAAIMEYIRSQSGVREARVTSARGILSQIENLDINSLTPGAPIDAIMQRGRPTALRKK